MLMTLFKVILKEVKEYKTASIMTPLFMVGEVLLEIMLPFLMSFIIDEGVSKGDMNAVFTYGHGCWYVLLHHLHVEQLREN